MTAASGHIGDRGHEMSVRVYWEDTDAGGIVYYANFLRYIERARSDMLRLAGLGQRELIDNFNLMFAVRNCDIEYLRPAYLDDVLQVYTKISKFAGATLGLRQIVSRAGEDLVRTKVRLACINLQGKPRRVPDDIVDLMSALPDTMRI